ncbi:MAG: type III secretion system chaperone [Chlamydiales bacterium]
MLREHLEKLCKELALKTPKLNEQNVFPLRLGVESLAIRDLDPGVALHANICETPKQKKEELFIYLMRANLLGQGTGGCRIGLNAGENFLTLSWGLPYELSYQSFRETIEDFVNYTIYWREEIVKFENEERVY